jgi:hypothetical protein
LSLVRGSVAAAVLSAGTIGATGTAASGGFASAGETIPFLKPVSYGKQIRVTPDSRGRPLRVNLRALRFDTGHTGVSIRAKCITCRSRRRTAFGPVSRLLRQSYPANVRFAVAFTKAGVVGRYLVIHDLASPNPAHLREPCLPPGSLRPSSCKELREKYRAEMFTVVVNGSGAGTVETTALTCTRTCSRAYNIGSRLSISETPANGSVFAGWSGPCTGLGTCTVTLESAQTLTATFDVKAPGPFYSETVGGDTQTHSDYKDAGGNEGPTIPSGRTVSISCRVEGFVVADGDPWWYRIASNPWNDLYYASADAFYNNGAMSGSLNDTPPVDPNVPECPQ